jgi:hypothetical protein
MEEEIVVLEEEEQQSSYSGGESSRGGGGALGVAGGGGAVGHPKQGWWWDFIDSKADYKVATRWEADYKVALLNHLAADAAGFPDLSGRPLSRANEPDTPQRQQGRAKRPPLATGS